MLVCLEKHYSSGMTYMLGRGIVGRSHEGVKEDWCRTMAGVGGGQWQNDKEWFWKKKKKSLLKWL